MSTTPVFSMVSGDSFFPSMGSISNRQFISRMKDWGWRVKKVRGEETVLETPGGKKVTVASAHTHSGNSQHTVNEVLSFMDMTWQEFIRPLDADMQLALRIYANLSPEEQDELWQEGKLERALDLMFMKARQRFINDREHERRRAARKQDKERKVMSRSQRRQPLPTIAAAPPPPEESATPPEATELPPVKPVEEIRQFTRGLTNRILDHLVASDQPMSTDRLCALEPDAKRASIQGALSNLVKYGVAQRVKPGVFRIRDEARKPGDVRVDVVAHAGAPDNSPVPPQTTATFPVKVGVSMMIPADDEESMNEVLDLLFPNGFKARHLPYIDAWRAATVNLLRVANESSSGTA